MEESFKCFAASERHLGAVTALAIAPDGKTLVSGSEDRSIKVWNLETGQLLRTLLKHSDPISSIAITPDGNYIVSLSQSLIKGLTVNVWNLAAGDILYTIESNSSEISAVAIAPDGKTIVTGTIDKKIEIWELTTGKLINTLTGHFGSISSLAIAPGNHQIVTGSRGWESAIEIWTIDRQTDAQTNNSQKQVASLLDREEKPKGKAIIVVRQAPTNPELKMPTPKSSDTNSQDRVSTILERLQNKYPHATYELNWETPEQMLVATILAAQCPDERVNEVTATLFQKYRTPQDFANADTAILEEDLKPTGFYRQKTQTVQTVCQALVARFGGKVPQTMAELTSISGIARKTANVVLNCCFNIPSGIIVDTHVARVSQRLGLSKAEKPDRIESDLMHLVPSAAWTFWGPAMVLHGRYTCKAKSPECDRCIFLDHCPQNGVEIASSAPKAIAEPIQNPKSKIQNRSSSSAINLFNSESWQTALKEEIQQPYFQQLLEFVSSERQNHTVFPPPAEVFTALELTPRDRIKAVILGQDPYHDEGQAHGLSFSVKRGVKLPPSLRNIFTELAQDLTITPSQHGDLSDWARQGVLLLNAVLTVRAHEPNSHKDKGWERFTDAIIRTVSQQQPHVVFVLWGRYAQQKEKLIDRQKHTIIKTAHPSPLSASNGFFGSRPFSKINDALSRAKQTEIDWSLPVS